MYEVKKAIYKVFNKWNSEYPAVAIRQESRMLLMEEGLNKFSASDVDKINFDWIKELRGEAKFVHAFHRPLAGGGSGGSGARGNPYRRRLLKEELDPDWRFWGMMPSVTLQQAVFLSIGVDPDVQKKLMREVDKARRYQHYAEARELLILNDMIVTRQRIAEKYVNNEELTLMEFLTILDRLQIHYIDQFKLAAQRAEENRILLGCISRKDEIHSLAINNQQQNLEEKKEVNRTHISRHAANARWGDDPKAYAMRKAYEEWLKADKSGGYRSKLAAHLLENVDGIKGVLTNQKYLAEKFGKWDKGEELPEC